MKKLNAIFSEFVNKQNFTHEDFHFDLLCFVWSQIVFWYRWNRFVQYLYPKNRFTQSSNSHIHTLRYAICFPIETEIRKANKIKKNNNIKDMSHTNTNAIKE